MGEDNNKEPKPQWKGCIIFGIVNIILVLLCTKLNIVMLSVALILLIVAGVVTTIQSIKEDWKEGFLLNNHPEISLPEALLHRLPLYPRQYSRRPLSAPSELYAPLSASFRYSALPLS